jgi:hypothetical protein
MDGRSVESVQEEIDRAVAIRAMRPAEVAV